MINRTENNNNNNTISNSTNETYSSEIELDTITHQNYSHSFINTPTSSNGDKDKSNDNNDINKQKENAVNNSDHIDINIQNESGNTQDGDTIKKSKPNRGRFCTVFYNYFEKWTGVPGQHSAPMVSFKEMFWSWLGSFIGIGIVAVLHYQVMEERDLIMLIGSFGASAVLIYGAPSGPLSQPRNLIGGHIVSAIVGVTVRIIFVDTAGLYPIGCFVSVSFAIVVMQLTCTLHPPGGATALIAVTSVRQPWAGYRYVLLPVGTGAMIMLFVALTINNLSHRRYPQYWI